MSGPCDFGIIVHGPEAVYSGEAGLTMAFLGSKGDVLARRGIHIIGITDGDRDGILFGSQKAEGSVILKVLGTTDDEAGAVLAKTIKGTNTFEGFLQRVKDGLGQMGAAYEACP
jgi:hypothetical protein